MTKPFDATVAYYDAQAEAFAQDTQKVAFSAIQDAFLSHLRPKASILDLGCGAGRDAKRFKELGFAVTAVDASSEMCRIASQYAGLEVICSTFEDYAPEQPFDGIWACASLLHVPGDDLPRLLAKYVGLLRPKGVFYLSFKYGDFEGERNGRHFTDMTEESLGAVLKGIPEAFLIEQSVTGDVRPGRSREKWLNALLGRI